MLPLCNIHRKNPRHSSLLLHLFAHASMEGSPPICQSWLFYSVEKKSPKDEVNFIVLHGISRRHSHTHSNAHTPKQTCLNNITTPNVWAHISAHMICARRFAANEGVCDGVSKYTVAWSLALSGSKCWTVSCVSALFNNTCLVLPGGKPPVRYAFSVHLIVRVEGFVLCNGDGCWEDECSSDQSSCQRYMI